jgi:hypothetical protein
VSEKADRPADARCPRLGADHCPDIQTSGIFSPMRQQELSSSELIRLNDRATTAARIAVI